MNMMQLKYVPVNHNKSKIVRETENGKRIRNKKGRIEQTTREIIFSIIVLDDKWKSALCARRYHIAEENIKCVFV